MRNIVLNQPVRVLVIMKDSDRRREDSDNGESDLGSGTIFSTWGHSFRPAGGMDLLGVEMSCTMHSWYKRSADWGFWS